MLTLRPPGGEGVITIGSVDIVKGAVGIII